MNPFWKNGGTGLPPTEEELRKEKEKERRAESRARISSSKPIPTFVGDVKVERNKLTGKLMRAEMKGDKKRARELQVKK